MSRSGLENDEDRPTKGFVMRKGESPQTGWPILARITWLLVLATMAGAVTIVLRIEQGPWSWSNPSELALLTASPVLALLGYKIGRIGPIDRWRHRKHPVATYFAHLVLALFVCSTYTFVGMISYFWDFPLLVTMLAFFLPSLALFLFAFPR